MHVHLYTCMCKHVHARVYVTVCEYVCEICMCMCVGVCTCVRVHVKKTTLQSWFFLFNFIWVLRIELKSSDS